MTFFQMLTYLGVNIGVAALLLEVKDQLGNIAGGAAILFVVNKVIAPLFEDKSNKE